MRFSLFYLPVIAAGETDARAAYRSIIEDAVWADEAGLEAVWIAEHHFDPYGGVIPSNALFGTAVAMKTKRIRIGAGVSILPLRSAVGVAEDFAMLDVLSDGRLEMGIGRGFLPHEFESLRIDMETQRHELYDEGVEVLTRAWMSERFSFSGRHYQIEDLAILPRPIQKPHPPIWVAASLSRESFELAGARGLNLMINPYTRSEEELARGLGWYRAALTAAGHDPSLRRIMANQHLYVSESTERAREDPREPLLRYLDQVEDAFAQGRGGAKTPKKITPHKYEELYPHKVLFGSPEQVVAGVERLRCLGITDICLMTQFGGLAREQVRGSLRLFVQGVMPAFG